jgi:hypothetical protein
MKRNASYFFFPVLMLLSLCSSAQGVFQRSFGGTVPDYGYAGLQTSDKGYAVFGYTRNFGAGRNDFYLLKTDSAGNLSWSKTYGGNGDDEGYSIQQTKDQGFILCGYTKSFGAGGYDVYLVKINASGDTLWTKAYGGPKDDFGNSVRQTADGGYIIAGYTLSYPVAQDSGSAYLLKTDANGKLEWSQSFGGSNQYTDAYSVQQTSDHGYAVSGYTNGFGELNGDVFLTKTDSLGHVLFTKTYGGKGGDWSTSVLQEAGGGFVMGGTVSKDSTGTDLDAVIIQTDASGDTLFTKIFGGSGNDVGQCLIRTAAGYATTGYTNSFGAGGYDGFMMKMDAAGDTVFCSTYGGKNDENLNGIALCGQGGFALSGFAASFDTSNFYRLYLVKTDSMGRSSCHQNGCPFAKLKPALLVKSVTVSVRTDLSQSSPTHTLISSGGMMTDACLPVGVTERTDAFKMLIYPNPSKGKITLSSENLPAGDYQLKIFNSLGTLVGNQTIKAGGLSFSEEISMDFPQGLYLVQLVNGNEHFDVKIILER